VQIELPGATCRANTIPLGMIWQELCVRTVDNEQSLLDWIFPKKKG
jgi:hypothetical protein